MTDDLSQFLRTSAGRAALSPENLELMGKEAATLLIEKNVPLDDGVVKVASQHPDMNAEQIRRVVEFANTAAYLSFHDKNKTAGAESSYPQFRLADPDVVLAKLGAAPQRTETENDSAYSVLPEKRSVSNEKREQALEELFLGTSGERVKTSAAHITDESAAHNFLSIKSDLQDLKQSLEHSGEQIQMLRKQAEVDYYDAMKRYVLDGGDIVDVIRGATESGLAGPRVAEMITPFLSQLQREKVANDKTLSKAVADFDKVAHREVDPDHPFVAGFATVVRLVDEENSVAEALQDIEAQIAKVSGAIQEGFLR